MTQSALAAAKQGNPQAIAALMNRQLNPKGIVAKATLSDRCLRVVLEGQIVPDEVLMSEYVRSGLVQLGVSTIEIVKLYGQATGEGIPAWSREMELIAKPEVFEPVRHVEPQVVAQVVESAVCCPKCGSQQVVANKKGFSAGKAVVGGLLLGPLGLLGGNLGSNELMLSCMKCGNRWQPSKTPSPVASTPSPTVSTPVPVARCTKAILKVPDEREGRRQTITMVFTCAIVGLIGFAIPLIGPVLIFLALIGAVLFIYWHLTGDRDVFSTLEGGCPHCGKKVSTAAASKKFDCAHCKQKIFVKEREFHTL